MSKPTPPLDLEAVKSELTKLEGHYADVLRQLSAMKRERDALRSREQEARGWVRKLVTQCNLPHEETPADNSVNCVFCQAARWLAKPLAPHLPAETHRIHIPITSEPGPEK